MKYRGIQVSISPQEVEFTRDYCVSTLCELSTSLQKAGYKPFPEEVEGCLTQFLGSPIDLESAMDLLASEDKDVLPLMFKSLFKDENEVLYFVDIERDESRQPLDVRSGQKPKYKPVVEIEIFSEDKVEMDESLDAFVDVLFKHFGITGPKNEVVRPRDVLMTTVFEELKDKLVQCFDPEMEDIYVRLGTAVERQLLREVKRAKSLFERDLPSLEVEDMDSNRIIKLLDYFSGAEMELLEKRYGILCKSSGELLCVLESRDDLEKAKVLECPHCKNRLQEEETESIYRPTDTLNDLLDNSRWMPLQLKKLLNMCGIPDDLILISAKHNSDEFDLLTLVGDTVLVFELKDRQVALGDAYKFTAKISRLRRLYPRLQPDSEVFMGRNGRVQRTRVPAGTTDLIVPVVVTTEFLQGDASDFLKDALDNCATFENLEEVAGKELSEFVLRMQGQQGLKRLRACCSLSNRDSISNLAGAFTEAALLAFLGKASQSAPFQ